MVSVRIPKEARRHPAVWVSRFKMRWPFFVWLLMIFVVFYLYYHGGRFSSMSGTVESLREQATPLETARLKAVHVIVGQEVRAGQLLAEMDTSILDAELVMEKLQEDRRFASAMADVETALQDTLIRQAEASGELGVLSSEIERLDDLLAKRLVDAQTVSRLRARQQSLSRALELYPGVIRNLEAELELAKRRRETVKAWFSADGNLVPTDAQPESEKDPELIQQLGLLHLRRDSYKLTARSDGVVSRILFKPGDVVPNGDPVVTIVVKGAQEVLGFLPESNIRNVQIGATAYLSRTTGRGMVVPARVTALTPEIVALPNRANPFPGMNFRGRQVILTPLAENDFIPGEGVTIDLDKPALTINFDLLIEKILAKLRKGA